MTSLLDLASIENPPPVTIYRFTVEEYHRLIELDVLNESHRVELLDGWIVPKMPHNPSHDGTIDLLAAAIRPLLPAGWYLRTQESLTTAESEPEPDLAIVHGSPRDFTNRHPSPREAGLIIEVADSSIHRDRGTKLQLYARAGIERYWIVNLSARAIEVHEGPTSSTTESTYRVRTLHGEGERIPLVVGDQTLGEIAIVDLLP